MSIEALPLVSEKCKSDVRAELNLDQHGITQAVETIKLWLRYQPHLPDDEDERILEAWLIRCKNSIEKTKETLDMYFTLRAEHSDIMCGWEPTESWFEKSSQYGYIFALPKLTPDLNRVLLFGYYTKELDDDYSVWDSVKLMLMVTEIRLVEDYNLKDIYIMDMKNLRFDHIKRITFTVVKKLEACFLTGYKSRMKAIHFVNTPTYAEVLVNVLKSVLKSKLVSRVFVHGDDLTELHKQVPKSILPMELGGECATLDQHWDLWKGKMKNYSSYFQKRETMKSDESKRINRKSDDSVLLGIEGSFRTLNID
ncbi:hypothetical protein L9F63_010701 [Diploptera punctata]|uniref:CRAL-TRIO domain-containing protein n=1 Tax=Diploptera punctata TaxID=6984 RepID=A0AAD8AGH7_DIPPU|nr:hypothetical protein L9F63_010701 [Diploptera punctata]